MRNYDNIVVGSGISGLTLTLLLGMNGHKVLLLEKNPHIGGSLARFYQQGVPLDKGFHFTGGMQKNGIVHDMLTVLGIKDSIEPAYLSHEHDNQVVFESEQTRFNMPPGHQNLRKKLKDYFPGEQGAIDRYFDMVENICSQTAMVNLRNIFLAQDMLDEDYISLEQVLNGLTDNRLLKGLLSVYCMLYGVKPKEISFANHSRACYHLYESLARVKNGGEAFIKAFRERFAQFDIEIMCNRYITEVQDIHDDNCVGRFILNNGEEVACDSCIFTIHPQEILKILPHTKLSKAFIDRVSSFEPSSGFFSITGTIERCRSEDDFAPTIISLLPETDCNQFFDPEYTGPQALTILKNRESINGNSFRLINVFELSFFKDVAAWKNSKTGQRPAGYRAYKQERIDSISKRLYQVYPTYKNNLTIHEAASLLTYRDYLHSPHGAAYGIKQKIGQYNLFGKLPLRNIYAAGQSSVLPGLVGAMISSFIIGRSIIDKGKYNRFIEQGLCN